MKTKRSALSRAWVPALILAWPVFGQLSTPPQQPIEGARMPALSPNGKQLAFAYRGDIWLVSSKGGRATPLTQHIETDAFPMFSPDGNWVAFGSLRRGGWDIFAVPTKGGESRQLTHHGGPELPFGWSPDGRSLLFSSRRDAPNYGLYAVEVATLRDALICEDYAPLNYPSWSNDGKWIAYGRYGFHWTRPRYQGSAAAELWLYDVDSNSRRALTRDGRQHLWPRFLPGNSNLVAVTVQETTPSSSPLDAFIPKVEDDPLRTPNLWRIDFEGHETQLTFFKGGSVRWPAVARETGDVAFEQGRDLWVLREGKAKPDKLRILAFGDEKQTTLRRETLKGDVAEAEPSPDGKSFAFGLRGDIWTIDITKPKGVAGRSAEFAKRLTDWVGEDSDFSWSADGKKLYFTSDRDFNTRIYELDMATLKTETIWNRTEDVTGLRLSPDGKQLAFWVSGPEGGLWVWTLETGESRRVMKVTGPHWRGMGGGSFSWSPDMKWLAYTFRGESRAWNIWIMPAKGGEAVNVTLLHAHHSQPVWSPDGNYLLFQSDRDGNGLYALPLRRELVRTDDTDITYVKPTNQVEVAIEFEDCSRRIRKIASQGPDADLTVTQDGKILFVSDGDIWTASFDGKEVRRLTSGGGKLQMRVSPDGRKVFYVEKGEMWTMNSDGKGAEKVTFSADWERDIREERRAAFTQFWRSYQRGFYDPNFHGRDWEAVRGRYEPLVDGVETDEEFATVLQMMIGELETSHAEVKASDRNRKAPATPHVGFTFDYGHAGPGIKVAQVPEGAPAWYEATRIKPGDYVLEINGTAALADERLYESINGKEGREFEFLVNDKPDKEGARIVKYKVLTQDEWGDLNYQNRVDRSRKHVDTASRGRIGYVHISAMGIRNQTRFEREIYEYMVGKDAMIIDVRFNSGGNIADTLIDWLERKPHGFTRPRDSAPEPSPYRAWEKPIVVVMNEHSYSNAEIFAYAMRARGLARLVGQPTPGYVIWTSGLTLVDGTEARMPQSGFYRLDGTPQENNGEHPDYLVELQPEDWLADRDPQLDKAIELLVGKPDPEPVVQENDPVSPNPAGKTVAE